MVAVMKLCGFLLILLYFAIPALIKMYPAIILQIAFLNNSTYFYSVLTQLL